MLGSQTQCRLIDKKLCEIDGKIISHAEVKKSTRPVFFADGDKVEFYIKIGNSTRLFNIREAIEYYEIHFASGPP